MCIPSAFHVQRRTWMRCVLYIGRGPEQSAVPLRNVGSTERLRRQEEREDVTVSVFKASIQHIEEQCR
jgi:hypothetical protein